MRLSARTTRRHFVTDPDADRSPPRSRAFRRFGQTRFRSTSSPRLFTEEPRSIHTDGAKRTVLLCCVRRGKLEWPIHVRIRRSPRSDRRRTRCDNEFMIKRTAAAALVRRARHSAGLTQRTLAHQSKIPQPTIAAIETGRQDPRFETLRSLIENCGREVAAVPRPGDGVDRTQIRELLRLTPGQRLRLAARDARGLDRLLRSTKR